MQTVKLSESAVFTLRNEIRGYRMPVTDRRLAAYRELAAAGIMEPVPGSESEYRFTEAGMEHREEILEREQDRTRAVRASGQRPLRIGQGAVAAPSGRRPRGDRG